MSTATDVHSIVAAGDVVACTLNGGYCVKRDGSRVLFEAARTIEDNRNATGRCTKLLVRFQDGSKLLFRWTPKYEHCYTVVK